MSGVTKIGFTEEQIDMLSAAERFCREKSPMEKVRKLMESERGFDADVWKEIGPLGWLGIAIPEEYGGVGLSLTEVVPVVEQMARRMMHSPFVATTLAAQAVIMGGDDFQKKKLLPEIAQGAAATVALSERNADWNLENIDTTARFDKTGYVLSGVKTFVADIYAAKWVIVSAKMEGGHIGLFIVPTDALYGEAIRREIIIDETKRSYELFLDKVFVDEEALLDDSLSSQILEHIHLAANLLSAAELTGAAQSCIDYTVEYLGTRKQFGKLIGAFQALKHPTVDAFVDYQKSRSLLYTAAYNFAQQGEGEVAVRMAKVKAEETLSFAADRSIQFHGGFGFTYDCDAQLYRRRAIFLASQYGDARYHKQKLADLLLKA
ncbi:acyl-CoA dehydrogenase family protein [Hellea balneolensis]|uniref:acyl-CoA dehydrogenase family protein n=1 Tax=Hellea balneolensis TaxID=287478 RepID=UPI00040E9C7E|nr:acyl-CoA dehydrogenase family protein [Hellea balneolensis]